MIRAAPTGPGHRHGASTGVPPPEGDGRHAPLRLPPYRCAEANPHRRGFSGFPTGRGGGGDIFRPPSHSSPVQAWGRIPGAQIAGRKAGNEQLFFPSSRTPS